MIRSLTLPDSLVRPSARRLAGLCFVAAVASSCSTLPSHEVAADGDGSQPTTTFVSTPPTSAPATTAPPTNGESTEATPAPTTAAPTTVPTTAAPTTAAPTTAAPTTAVPTTAAPTTAAPTTVVPTTAVPTTAVPTTVAEDPERDAEVAAGQLQELPYTGPREAVLFGLIGLAMIVVGRTVLDLFGFFSRITPTGEKMPSR